MEIKIDQHFIIQVPTMTDYLSDLQKLYKINFGMFEFSNEDYEILNRKIVLSKNSNWNKAIALVILNEKLIAKTIFTKKPRDTYPYYSYPYIYMQEKITYIIESLAMHSINPLVKNLKQETSNKVSTYIINSLLYSRSLDKDHLMGANSQLQHMAEFKQKHEWSTSWVDAIIKYRRLYGKVPDYEEQLVYVKNAIANNKQLQRELKKKIKFYVYRLSAIELLPPSSPYFRNSSRDEIDILFDLLLKLQPTEINAVLKNTSSHDRYNLCRMLKFKIAQLKKETKLNQLDLLYDQERLLRYILKNVPSPPLLCIHESIGDYVA